MTATAAGRQQLRECACAAARVPQLKFTKLCGNHREFNGNTNGARVQRVGPAANTESSPVRNIICIINEVRGDQSHKIGQTQGFSLL